MLPLHVDDGFQHLVTYGDDFRVGLEAALGDDHVGELIGNVHIGHFESRSGDFHAQVSGGLDIGGAGVIGFLVEGTAGLGKAGEIVVTLLSLLA